MQPWTDTLKGAEGVDYDLVGRLYHALPNRVPFIIQDATEGELQEVTAPTIVLGADRDPVHPLTLARRWADLLPNAIFHQVPARDEDPGGYEHQTQRLVRDHIVQT